MPHFNVLFLTFLAAILNKGSAFGEDLDVKTKFSCVDHFESLSFQYNAKFSQGNGGVLDAMRSAINRSLSQIANGQVKLIWDLSGRRAVLVSNDHTVDTKSDGRPQKPQKEWVILLQSTGPHIGVVVTSNKKILVYPTKYEVSSRARSAVLRKWLLGHQLNLSPLVFHQGNSSEVARDSFERYFEQVERGALTPLDLVQAFEIPTTEKYLSPANYDSVFEIVFARLAEKKQILIMASTHSEADLIKKYFVSKLGTDELPTQLKISFDSLECAALRPHLFIDLRIKMEIMKSDDILFKLGLPSPDRHKMDFYYLTTNNHPIPPGASEVKIVNLFTKNFESEKENGEEDEFIQSSKKIDSSLNGFLLSEKWREAFIQDLSRFAKRFRRLPRFASQSKYERNLAKRLQRFQKRHGDNWISQLPAVLQVIVQGESYISPEAHLDKQKNILNEYIVTNSNLPPESALDPQVRSLGKLVSRLRGKYGPEWYMQMPTQARAIILTLKLEGRQNTSTADRFEELNIHLIENQGREPSTRDTDDKTRSLGLWFAQYKKRHKGDWWKNLSLEAYEVWNHIGRRRTH